MIALAIGALVSWVLRIGFITLLPADRLHPRVRRVLRHVGPAVLGAMIATSATWSRVAVPSASRTTTGLHVAG
jgi:branched-subunit amino acid transport protein